MKLIETRLQYYYFASTISKFLGKYCFQFTLLAKTRTGKKTTTAVHKMFAHRNPCSHDEFFTVHASEIEKYYYLYHVWKKNKSGPSDPLWYLFIKSNTARHVECCVKFKALVMHYQGFKTRQKKVAEVFYRHV